MKEMFEIKVPFHSKKSKCVCCGISVGSKGKSHQMKKIAAGFQKTMDLWLKYQILIDFKHHFFCSNCFKNDVEIPFKYSNEINNEYLLSLLTKSFVKIEKEKQQKKEKIKKKEKRKGKKYPLFSFESFEYENIIYLSGISKKNLIDLSQIINHPIEKIF